MHKRMPTQEDIDTLLAYLPLFETPGRTFITRWGGGTPRADGTITAPYPVYADDVSRFSTLAAQNCWSDTDYDPVAAGRMLEDNLFMSTADMQDIRTILTYCVRGERFCDGHWGKLLANGQVIRLLHRLREMQDQPSES